MTTVDTIMLRRALVATLRDTGSAMTTRELADRMPWTTETLNANCQMLTRPLACDPPTMRVVTCYRDWHVVSQARNGHTVYKHLCSLVKQRVLHRIPVNARLVRWKYIGEDSLALNAGTGRTSVRPTGRQTEEGLHASGIEIRESQ